MASDNNAVSGSGNNCGNQMFWLPDGAKFGKCCQKSLFCKKFANFFNAKFCNFLYTSCQYSKNNTF